MTTGITELLKTLSFDMQIEIIENEYHKDWTESEKAEIQAILKKHFEKQKKPGRRTDLHHLTYDKRLSEVVPEQASRTASSTPAKEETRINTKIGEVLGESYETVRKREKVFENIDEDTKKLLDTKKTSLHGAYQKAIERENAKKTIPALPAGKFNHIVEDPGWYFKNRNIGGSGKSGASHKYRTMPTVDIARIPVRKIAAADAILYMWTTNQHLISGSMLQSDFLQIAYGHTAKQTEFLGNTKVQSDALSVVACRGFRPRGIITWQKEDKEGWGGYWFNNVTEHLIVATRGNVAPFGQHAKTIVSTPHKRSKDSHSVKPEKMWDLIEEITKTQRWKNRKIELNCRNPRAGWHPHGDEITDKDIREWSKLK